MNGKKRPGAAPQRFLRLFLKYSVIYYIFLCVCPCVLLIGAQGPKYDHMRECCCFEQRHCQLAVQAQVIVVLATMFACCATMSPINACTCCCF